MSIRPVQFDSKLESGRFIRDMNQNDNSIQIQRLNTEPIDYTSQFADRYFVENPFTVGINLFSYCWHATPDHENCQAPYGSVDLPRSQDSFPAGLDVT